MPVSLGESEDGTEPAKALATPEMLLVLIWRGIKGHPRAGAAVSLPLLLEERLYP